MQISDRIYFRKIRHLMVFGPRTIVKINGQKVQASEALQGLVANYTSLSRWIAAFLALSISWAGIYFTTVLFIAYACISLFFAWWFERRWLRRQFPTDLSAHFIPYAEETPLAN